MQEVMTSLRDDPSRIAHTLWMRVERQTLCRLPDSNAVAFSLHTYSDPLACLEGDAASLRAIRTLLGGYSPARWQYSEMDIVREPLLAWLDAALNRSQTEHAADESAPEL
jgi:dimethylamine monooxygenase subunit A